MAGELTKGKMGKDDLQIQTNTDTAETYDRTSSTGGTQELTKFPDIWDGTGRIDIAQIDLGAKQWITGTAAPTSGTYAVGDICWNTAPSSEEAIGWTCITAGTPGTWKPFGQIIPQIPWTQFSGFIRGLEVSRKDADEIYVSGGIIHINDGTDDLLLECSSQLTKALSSPTADKTEYIYVDPPASGSTLVAADIEHSSTAPTYDHAKKGWYHPTTTDLRFIGSVPITSGGDIYAGNRSQDGHYWEYDDEITLATGLTSTSFADITNIEDRAPHIDNAMAILRIVLESSDNGNIKTAHLRKNGSTSTNGHYASSMYGKTGGQYGDAITQITLDANGKAEYKINNSTNTDVNIYIQGYWEPR